jgi:hypothetical protein
MNSQAHSNAMTDLKCADLMEYNRMLVNTAREADDNDARSIRLARKRLSEIKRANPQFSGVTP